MCQYDDMDGNNLLTRHSTFVFHKAQGNKLNERSEFAIEF